MLFGRSIVHWIVTIFLAICIFIVARWAIPLLFGLVGVAIPDQIVVVLSLLIAAGFVYGGYTYRGAPVP